MHVRLRSLLPVTCCMSVFLSAIPETQNQSASGAAWLVTFSGRVRIERGSSPARELTKNDAMAPLLRGDRLTCVGPSSSFVILTGAMKKAPIDHDACAGGYPIPAAFGGYAPVLERYGRTGGRARGALAGLLIWPEPDVHTLPETASHVQWRPQERGSVTLTLTESGSGRIIWRRPDVDATLGKLDDQDLEAALRAQVAASKSLPVLEVRFSPMQSATAAISLLDQAAERSVRRQLTATTAGLMDEALHLVRADVFLQADLRREALDEYLAILESAPESASVLDKASALAMELSDLRAAGLVRRARAASLGRN